MSSSLTHIQGKLLHRTKFRQHEQAGSKWSNWPVILTGLLLFIVFLVFLGAVQFSTPDLPDNDGFYHIKMAYLMGRESIKPAFPWLPLTILNPREFYDHHFLFHVALIPFTYIDLRLGAKIASVFFASLSFLAIWWLLRGQRVPYAVLWALGLLAVSEAFIFRMSITRAQSLSLAVLVIGLHWLLNRRYALLLPLAFFYVWLYDAFPLLLVLVGLYVLAVLLIERRLELRPLMYTGAGITLGMLVNPYFPDNIIFVFRHILPKISAPTEVRVGNEWYPYTTSQLLDNSPLALAIFISGGLALGWSGRRMDTRTAAAFFLSVLFGLLLFQSRRFIEYFPAFSIIFAAFAWTPIIKDHLERVTQNTSSNNSSLALPKSILTQTRVNVPLFLMLLFLLPGIILTLHASQDSIRSSKPFDLYKGASVWLEQNTLPGERVFQTDWDDFPRLFFYNHKNTYIVGLDPTYLQLYNPGLYDLWVQITGGKIEHPSQAILERFSARYVISDLKHDGFLEQAIQDPAMQEVYRDNQSVVYELK